MSSASSSLPFSQGNKLESPFGFAASKISENDQWLAEIPEIPGVMAVAASRNEAINKAHALAFLVLGNDESPGDEKQERWREHGLELLDQFIDLTEGPRTLLHLATLLHADTYGFEFNDAEPDPLFDIAAFE